jgi:hypothetical protein
MKANLQNPSIVDRSEGPFDEPQRSVCGSRLRSFCNMHGEHMLFRCFAKGRLRTGGEYTATNGTAFQSIIRNKMRG